MASQIITLTTDFGDRDGFVAAMKGVILNISPDVTLVDVSHEIPPQDIVHASFVLGSSSAYFPHGTIHVAVVDPGVGSARHPMLVETSRAFFIGPDNGIFSNIFLNDGLNTSSLTSQIEKGHPSMSPAKIPVPQGISAYVLNRPDYWLSRVSNTFQGRDIFAPVAAHLASGIAPNLLGQAIGEVTILNLPHPITRGDHILGHVVFIDRFGNLISNIPMSNATERGIEIKICGRKIQGLSQSYYNATSGLLATVGSHGFLEIAVRKGNASTFLEAGVGTPIEMRLL